MMGAALRYALIVSGRDISKRKAPADAEAKNGYLIFNLEFLKMN